MATNYVLQNPVQSWLTSDHSWKSLCVNDLSPLDRASLIDQVKLGQYLRTLTTVLSMMQQQPHGITQREHLLFSVTLQQIVDELVYVYENYELIEKTLTGNFSRDE